MLAREGSMNSFLGRNSGRIRLQFGKRAVMILLIALLVVGWLVISEVAEGRKSIGQNDRLTPIQREIERQRQRLTSIEAEERRDALMRLGNLKRPEASRAAATSLSDANPVVRMTAAHSIVSLPSHEAASLLISLLKDKSEFVRREAASVLAETHDRSAVGPLIEVLLHDKWQSVRAAAAVTLGQIGDETAVQPLAQVLTKPSGKKSKKVNTEDEFLMRSVARSLGQIRSHAAVPALVAALENEQNVSDVRREAATALGLIGDSSAVSALQAAYYSAGDPYLSEAAHVALRQIARAKK